MCVITAQMFMIYANCYQLPYGIKIETNISICCPTLVLDPIDRIMLGNLITRSMLITAPCVQSCLAPAPGLPTEDWFISQIKLQ